MQRSRLSQARPTSDSVLLALLLFAVAVVLSACFELEQTLEIRADGTGRLIVKLSMQKEKLRQLEQRLRGLEAGPGDTGTVQGHPFDIERIRRSFKPLEHVRLTKIERFTTETSSGIHVAIDFDSTEALAKGMAALVSRRDAGIANRMQIWFVRGPQHRVRMIVYPSGRAEYDRSREQVASYAKLSAEQRTRQAQMFGMMRHSLEGLRITYRFVVPGKIFRHGDAQKVSDSEVVFRIVGDRVKSMSEMTRLSGLRFEIEFDGAAFTGQLLDAEPSRKPVAPSGGPSGGK